MYSKARLVATLILLALLAHTFSVGSINLQASDPGVPLGELPQDRKPPQEAVAACTGKAEEDACAFTTPHRGLESGTCALSQEGLACAPQRGEQPGGSSPEGKQSMTHRAMTIEQTVSDEAQRNTIAFDALAFLTGDLCADSFLPPQKWPISLASSICGTTTRTAWDTTRTS